jgi:hypothetical protein
VQAVQLVCLSSCQRALDASGQHRSGLSQVSAQILSGSVAGLVSGCIEWYIAHMEVAIHASLRKPVQPSRVAYFLSWSTLHFGLSFGAYYSLKPYLPSDSSLALLALAWPLLAVGRIVCFPFLTVSNRVFMSPSSAPVPSFTSIARQEGLTSLFKGATFRQPLTSLRHAVALVAFDKLQQQFPWQ